MTLARSRKGVLNDYNAAPAQVQKFFVHLPKLLDDLSLDVSLSYVFSQVELAQNLTLYCGIVKLHRADSTLARTAIDTHHMSRGDFKQKFEAVFGKPIPEKIGKLLETAEATRDRVMHGKSTTEKEKRQALVDVLQYAREFNELVVSLASFRPFGELRGFKGRAKPLDKSTTRWLLKGMGFSIS